ncbi:MAG: hypothetical protein IT442_14485 [Phycisphaeraceae bacterium]|nr:hypothetical protein [Phycisphaeraceae bacterium]
MTLGIDRRVRPSALCPTATRATSPAILTEMMRRHCQSPAMGLFGCFCGGEVCLTLENDFTTGGDRLACVAMRWM